MNHNKKGSIDNIYVLIAFLGVALFMLVMTVTWNLLSSEVDDLWSSSKGANIKGNMERASNNFDTIVLMAWLGLHLGILVTAYLLRTHPVMFILLMFITMLIAAMAAPISNAWNEIGLDDTILMAARNEMPKTDFIMSKLPMFEVIWSLITGAVMFSLARSEGMI